MIDYIMQLAEDVSRMRHAAIEEACEMSLVDPEGRGVLVHEGFSPGEFSVELDSSVPFGHIHQLPWGVEARG